MHWMLGTIFFGGMVILKVNLQMLAEYFAGSEQQLSLQDERRAGFMCLDVLYT
jgi:hypothetical protein